MIDCPQEQAVAARIRQERQAGRGLREIARLLDAEGITCRGRRWHHSTVQAILSRAGGRLAEAS
jgi:Recombinase